jgi:S-adenosylmethionine hydrolase
MSRKPSVLTLLTDFGTADYFVGAMKGVILDINPNAQLVDITHEIPAQDIESGAFTILSSYQSFPSKTIHVAVVDPGVGSQRRAIAVRAKKQFFVGPDNGLFSYVMERESTYEVVHLTAEKYFRHPLSQTFHGRDVFAPVAAAISKGVKFSALGPRVTDPVRLPTLAPLQARRNEIEGRIIHIDHFGNCMTNFTREQISVQKETEATLLVKGKRIKTFRQFYEDDASREKLFAIWGSAGFVEIAAQNSSAANVLKAERGTKVVLLSRS